MQPVMAPGFDVVQGVATEALPSGIAATRVDELIWPRDEPGPAFELPIAEVIDFLVELGRNLDHRLNPHLSEAMASLAVDHPLGPRVLEHYFAGLPAVFDRGLLEFEFEQALGSGAGDGWRPIVDHRGRLCNVRPFPPRLVHILPGNVPGAAADHRPWRAEPRGPSPQDTFKRSVYGSGNPEDDGRYRCVTSDHQVVLLRVLEGW